MIEQTLEYVRNVLRFEKELLKHERKLLQVIVRSVLKREEKVNETIKFIEVGNQLLKVTEESNAIDKEVEDIAYLITALKFDG